MSKLLDLNQLNKLAQSLDSRAKNAIETEKERALATEADLQTAVDGIRADMLTVNAVKLNGFSIWVGTTEELNEIETRDPNTLYFEVGDAENSEQIVQNNPIEGILVLTKNKYQKATISGDTVITFPTVTGFTEIHLYLQSSQDMNFIFPGDKKIEFKSSEKDDPKDNMNITFPNCKWRMEPNVDYGRPYEIIATYNSIDWLIDVVVYS